MTATRNLVMGKILNQIIILFRCSSKCQVELGYTCKWSDKYKRSVCHGICGDGLNFGEYPCDDGNTKSGDGCSCDCLVETGWYCSGGSPCSKDVCERLVGTGTLEECNKFADKFESTCCKEFHTDFKDIKSDKVKCKVCGDGCPGERKGKDDKHGKDDDDKHDHDDDDKDECTFKRKLCVTCSERDGARWIRV